MISGLTVGTSGTDIVLDSVSITETQTVTITAGTITHLGTATEIYYDQDGTTVRITFSPTDEAGNGTPVVTP